MSRGEDDISFRRKVTSIWCRDLKHSCANKQPFLLFIQITNIIAVILFIKKVPLYLLLYLLLYLWKIIIILFFKIIIRRKLNVQKNKSNLHTYIFFSPFFTMLYPRLNFFLSTSLPSRLRSNIFLLKSKLSHCFENWGSDKTTPKYIKRYFKSCNNERFSIIVFMTGRI